MNHSFQLSLLLLILRLSLLLLCLPLSRPLGLILFECGSGLMPVLAGMGFALLGVVVWGSLELLRLVVWIIGLFLVELPSLLPRYLHWEQRLWACAVARLAQEAPALEGQILRSTKHRLMTSAKHWVPYPPQKKTHRLDETDLNHRYQCFKLVCFYFGLGRSLFLLRPLVACRLAMLASV